VKVADEAGGAAQLGVLVQEVELVGPGGCAGYKGQDLAPVLIDAERAGCTVEAGLVQVGEQRVDGRRPRPRRAPNGVTHLDDSAAHVAAAQRRLGACHCRLCFL
jgi:hypothetical protein